MNTLYTITFVDEVSHGDEAREVRRGDMGFEPMTLREAQTILRKLMPRTFGRLERRYVIQEVRNA